MGERLRSAGTRLLRQWESGHSSAGARTLAGGYRGLLHAREWLYERRVLKSRTLPCAVISIGNLTVGGTGKTPAVELAVQALVGLGARPAIVSRGYGRRSKGVQVVADRNGLLLDARDAGDEPALLAHRLPGVPVVVGANRYDAACLALARFGVSAIVLDDGLQHRSLVKDVEIAMVQGAQPWGNGCLFPAGRLREPVEALARADLIVVSAAPGRDAMAEIEAVTSRVAPGVPVLRARHEPVDCREAGRTAREPARALAGKRLVGFTGIAWPEGFRRTLQGVGVTLTGFEAFPDHFWYRPADLDRLSAMAVSAGADGLVTTEKDWVRLGALSAQAMPVWVLGIRLVLESGDSLFHDVLRRALG